MKKIKWFKNPFLYGFIIDIIGYAIFNIILYSQHGYSEFTIFSITISIFAFIAIMMRAIFTSVSFSIIKYINILRVVIYNINVDIKIQKLFIKKLGFTELYSKRIELLKNQKKHAKLLYQNFALLNNAFWEFGYSIEALTLVLTNMLKLGDQVDDISSPYRKK